MIRFAVAMDFRTQNWTETRPPSGCLPRALRQGSGEPIEKRVWIMNDLSGNVNCVSGSILLGCGMASRLEASAEFERRSDR